MAFAELAWRPQAVPGLVGAVEVVHQSGMAVNDANTDRTSGHTAFNLRVGLEQRVGGWRLREFVRVDNVTERRYVGSVIANDGNGRFFEPAPGRNWTLGISAQHAF
jgi:iron complex outermembrane receptor protein